MEDVNLKVFNMVKVINESKILIKQFSFECRCEFDDRKCNWKWKWNNDKCQFDCRIPMKHFIFKEDYAESSRQYFWECF